ncbi:glycosyltransferase family 2 protein [Jannaschia sp. W003]|uniref:glycosyltransferase family 2 protein n=1 Tax=Jannaschia sp. W003 TaxID=2867012 RepID=UPI0021A2FE4D|nr:glycosyltransferase [Jannaschia sp. W003]UWQ21080.1 glycosyltransferase [Jannaschia sp. W003]
MPFFRRRALEAAGAWDAHNVTEDADLGVRLARAGYRTEVIGVTTMEEAAAAPGAWVRQRSRWMKGYMMTWSVHAARPVALLRDLGWRRSLGFHALFLGAILNAAFLPFMWSTLVMTFGVPHPVARGMPEGFAWGLAVAMPAMTLLNIAVGRAALRAEHHRPLRRWVPTMELYFPLATLAVARAAVELVLRPFHWEKTAHGAFGGADADAGADTADPPAPAPVRPLRLARAA